MGTVNELLQPQGSKLQHSMEDGIPVMTTSSRVLQSLPMDWFEKILVPGTSKNLKDADEPETNLGEMLCWLGLKGLMASHVGFSQ